MMERMMVMPHITIKAQSKEMEKIRWPSVILEWLLKMCSQALYSPKKHPTGRKYSLRTHEALLFLGSFGLEELTLS
jgi:hypothetical protein